MITRICLAISLTVLIALPAALAAQQKRVQSKAEYAEWVKTRKAYKRVQWFNKQRQNPDGTIPVDIYWAERGRVIREQRALGKAVAGHLEWQSVGPHGVNALPAHWGVTSGRVRGLAIHPQDPETVYIGVAAGGIWKTTNGGASWTSLGNNFESLTFGAIAIDPQNPQTVYAGTGEVRFGFNTVLYDGKGLFKTTDGGATWAEITTDFGTRTHFAALAVAPNTSNVVYAALASGYSFVGSLNNEGIWRSGDGGVNWTQVIPINDAFDIAPHPSRSGEVFAAIGGGNNDSSGVWFSSDFGQTWTRRSSGLPDSPKIDRIQIALSPDATNTVYAIVFTAGDRTRIFKSTDNATSWSHVASGIAGNYGDGPVDQGGYDLCIAVNPNDADDVWAGNVELYRSTDGDKFSVVRNFGVLQAWDSPMHVDYHIIRFAPSNPGIIYVGNDGGIYRSSDGGGSWNSLGAGLNTLQFYRLASSPHNANTLIGGAQDNGIIGNKNVTGGINQRWDNLSTGDGFDCFFDPTNPNIVYASTQNTNLYKSTSGLDGFNFIGIPTAGRIINGIPDNERNLRFATIFFMHPTDSKTLFTATNRVYRTTDAGENWTARSQPIVGVNNPIQALAISRSEPQNFIAGIGSRVFVSTNGAATWTERTDTTNFPNRTITRVVTHPHQDSTLFVLFGGFTGGNSIFMSTDLGLTWSNITANLPNVPHSDLFVDPQFAAASQVLYVANDLGVYATTDGGSSWVRESNGMPIVPALDFDYHFGERLLRVATHGRSIFQASLPLTALAITAPNGGEQFAIGGTYTIRWLGAGFGNPQTVRLEYSLNNGATWQLLQDAVPNTGTYDWLVTPNILPTNQALVRVINPENENIVDASNATFSIFRDAYFTVNTNSPFASDLGTFTSAAWADYDNDGDLDISLTSEHPTAQPLRLYRNSDGAFTNVNPGILPGQAFGASWGDFDKDGDLDLMAVGVQKKLLRNLGNGTFADATGAVFSGLPAGEFTSVSWVDFDRDNRIDLFVTTGRYDFGKNSRNILFRQTTPGRLVATYFEGNFDSRNAVWGDYNNDGYPDVFVVNHSGQTSRLYTTLKDGANVIISDDVILLGSGHDSNAAAWGDYDNDGDLDVFFANDGSNALYRNDGNGVFSRISGTVLNNTISDSKTCTWGDFDNDGHLDLFVGNDGPNNLYRNLGNGTFEAIELSAVTTVDDYTSSAAWGDYDNDGDLDLLVANGVIGTSETERSLLYRSKLNSNGNNWLQVKLHGIISNLTGIGARITVYHQEEGGTTVAKAAGRAVAGHSSLQIREISGLTGTGQNSTIAHFGLGPVTEVDSLVVQWPSRRRTVLTEITANQRLTVFELENNRFLLSTGGDLGAARNMTASAWGDLDGDGLDDLVLVGKQGQKGWYRNNGNGTFQQQMLGDRASRSDDFTAAILADFDNDGDLDVLVANHGGANLLFANSGAPDFKLVQVTKGVVVQDNERSTAASWGDFNNDGRVDLFVANTTTNALYLNKGGSTFSRVTSGPVVTDRGAATGCAWVDIDDDGDLDLFVTYSDRKDILYRNSGAPNYTFSKVAAGKLVQGQPPSLGASWRDFDLDGDLDVYVLKNSENELHLNNGDGTFTRTTKGDGLDDIANSRSSAWTDVNNNGFPDVFVANDGVDQLYSATSEKSLIANTVTAATLTSGQHAGVSWADVDDDGFPDLIVNNTSGSSRLYRNSGGIFAWLKVTCVGTVTNASAIGTRISVKADLSIKFPGIWQTQEISAQTGTGSQNSLTQIFGLGQATVIDSLIVDWPRSGALVLTNVEVNQHLILHESARTRFRQDKQAAFSQLNLDASGITWADIDNDGDQDAFITTLQNENVLLTNNKGTFALNSKSGLTDRAMPSAAATWADIDNDDDLDVFIVNSGESSLLYLNQGRGRFASTPGGELKTAPTTATGASWGDFDNDGLVDLFIPTGGKGNLLFRNQGNREFKQVKSAALVKESFDSRSAAWADVNNDGRLDLFVVNFNQRNQLFLNEGNGTFTEVGQAPFTEDEGASVGCSWGDFDNDGWLDLFVANQGGTDFLYRNNSNGTFSKVQNTPVTEKAGASTGSSWIDFDNDGDLDLYVTTFGEGGRLFRNLGNGFFERETGTPLTANKNKVRGQAWADYDGNGTPDALVAVDGEPMLFNNAGSGTNWIRLELRGTQSNRAAIGAQVRLKAFIGGRAVWQTRQVTAQSGGGMSGQNSLWLTFGLGRASVVDSVVIAWPSETVQVSTGLAVNRIHRILESAPTTVADTPELPSDYILYQNFPNPFNPETTIRFALPESEFVVLKIYDLQGREVATLVQEQRSAGRHTAFFNASHLPSGVYVYRIQAGRFQDAKKFVLVK
ncbi:MAG: FG-GAP-like repeat-containing protein [candidate division KSB1 bacterium]|nr:FG-GAP-like repeat-containing protein [candidate division KSB1 bacterium]